MKNLSGTVILITGGTGSFGNRVARHLLKQKPAQIRIYSRDEKKQWEMQRIFPQFRYIVGAQQHFFDDGYPVFCECLLGAMLAERTGDRR